MKYPTRNLQHIVICPKWRKPFFEFKIHAGAVEKLIRHICSLHQIEIAALAVQPDHVHLMCYLPNTYNLAYAIQQIKWFSSIWMRKCFPEFKVHKAFWATHYWATSVGNGRAAQMRYIENQVRNIGD